MILANLVFYKFYSEPLETDYFIFCFLFVLIVGSIAMYKSYRIFGIVYYCGAIIGFYVNIRTSHIERLNGRPTMAGAFFNFFIAALFFASGAIIQMIYARAQKARMESIRESARKISANHGGKNDPLLNIEEQSFAIHGMLNQTAVEREIEWRDRPENSSDASLLENMFAEINELGIHGEYEYLEDLRQAPITDTGFFEVVLRYIGKYENWKISLDLLLMICHLGGNTVTKMIIDAINRLPASDNRVFEVFDKAIVKLMDRRYQSEYMQWLSEPRIAKQLPLTMEMLARWNVPEAKPLFIRYLDTEAEESVALTSIIALSYYDDEEVTKKIRDMQNHQNEQIRRCAAKVAEMF